MPHIFPQFKPGAFSQNCCKAPELKPPGRALVKLREKIVVLCLVYNSMVKCIPIDVIKTPVLIASLKGPTLYQEMFFQQSFCFESIFM